MTRSFRALCTEAGLLPPTIADAEVTSLAGDSRAVRPGALFVARKGALHDGHDHVAAAVAAGASAVAAERPVETSVPIVLLEGPSAVARLAAVFHGRPSEAVRVVGVTGTNGKTTTTYLIRAALAAAGTPCGVVGTVGYDVGGGRAVANLTTPDPITLQGLLAEARDRGLGAVAMEVSSHALALGRVDEVTFAAGVFTNLTPDHLDFHRDMEDYFAAKRRLFVRAPRGAVHVGDPYGRRLAAEFPGLLSFARAGAGVEADLLADGVRLGLEGTRIVLRAGGETAEVETSLLGLPNVENALAAAAAGLALGAPLAAIARGLAAAAAPPGRFERVENDRGFQVVVDYAHTPDALERLLETGRALGPRRILLVFGCGGDRDRTKRPVMGRIATKRADLVFATSDNPRTEDPERILDEILAGRNGSGAPVRRIADRRAAIRAAISEAGPGDLVLVAGKGHEDYQIVGRERRPFDDRTEAREALAP